MLYPRPDTGRINPILSFPKNLIFLYKPFICLYIVTIFLDKNIFFKIRIDNYILILLLFLFDQVINLGRTYFIH